MSKGKLTPDKVAEIRKKARSKWDSLGFLDGLKGPITDERIIDLFTCEASKLLNETTNQWAVYIVECSDGSLYTGISNNVSKRVKTHNDGKGAKYTKTRLPVALKWLNGCDNRSEASKEEYRIKKLTRKQKLELINKSRVE